MLREAASNATPTKYAQKRCHGIQAGTCAVMNFAAPRCSVPKIASGTAMHIRLRATIFSDPRAFVRSGQVVAAATKNATPAAT